MKNKILSFVIVLALSLTTVSTSFAREPYDGYTYSTYGERVPSPNAYLPKEVITGVDMGIGQLNTPSDIFVDSNDDIYIVDTGNNRIVILDKGFKLKKVLDKFTLKSTGAESPIKDASGVFAVPDQELIYIADKGNQRVAVCDYNGVIVREIRKPVTELLGDEIVFAPRKVVVNSIGTAFILSENINQGMVSIDDNDVFQGFFGAERIQLTAAQVIDLWWRNILSKEQRSQTMTFQPTEYANIFLDSEDFIYTATALETYEKAQVKRLNPAGTNILYEDMRYGDLNAEFNNGVATVSAILDVTVDDEGFIFALDRNFGRIYMYDEQSWNLAIFGKKDTSFGCFSEPVSIEAIGKNVLVLDSAKASVFVFEPTEYGDYMRSAINFHYKGRYSLALEPWDIVRQMNNNYEMAYAGIARAEYMDEEYKESMENFKLAKNNLKYSDAKKKNRTVVLRKNFTAIVSTLLILIIGIYVITKKNKEILAFFKKKRKGGRNI